MRNTRSEYFTCDMPSATDIARTCGHFREVPGKDIRPCAKSEPWLTRPWQLPGAGHGLSAAQQMSQRVGAPIINGTVSALRFFISTPSTGSTLDHLPRQAFAILAIGSAIFFSGTVSRVELTAMVSDCDNFSRSNILVSARAGASM